MKHVLKLMAHPFILIFLTLIVTTFYVISLPTYADASPGTNDDIDKPVDHAMETSANDGVTEPVDALKPNRGWELLASLGYVMLAPMGAEQIIGEAPRVLPFGHGLGVTVSGSYRWGWIGIFMDLDIGGTFNDYSYKEKPTGNRDVQEHMNAPVMMAFTIGPRFIYTNDHFEFWGQIGIGTSAMSLMPFFSVKAAIGTSYFIKDNFGIGFDVAYVGLLPHIKFSPHLRFKF